MHAGKMIFAKLTDFISQYEFKKCVEKYDGERRVRKFSCRDQYLCMAFAQLTSRESLRDIESCLRTKSKKLYHLGIRGKVAISTLARANDRRDWRIYQDFRAGGGLLSPQLSRWRRPTFTTNLINLTQ